MTSAKSSPRVSVGMPAYNSGKWLRKSVDSILNQSFTDLELIISDNASTDDTEAICRDYVATDSRVRYYRKGSKASIFENYDTVFEYANGEYFKWASSNDICGDGFLRKCVGVLDQRPDVVLCYPRTRLFSGEPSNAEDYDDALDLPDDDPCTRFAKVLDTVRLNNAMNGLIRRDVLSKTALNKEYFSSDTNLLAELALYGKFVEIPEFLFYRRMDPETATSLKSKEEEIQYSMPDNSDVSFQNWQYHWEAFARVWRAPLTTREKLRLCAYLSKRVLWARRDLVSDLREAFSVVRRRRP